MKLCASLFRGSVPFKKGSGMEVGCAKSPISSLWHLHLIKVSEKPWRAAASQSSNMGLERPVVWLSERQLQVFLSAADCMSSERAHTFLFQPLCGLGCWRRWGRLPFCRHLGTEARLLCFLGILNEVWIFEAVLGQYCLLKSAATCQSLRWRSFLSLTTWPFQLEKLGVKPEAFLMQSRYSSSEPSSLLQIMIWCKGFNCCFVLCFVVDFNELIDCKLS